MVSVVFGRHVILWEDKPGINFILPSDVFLYDLIIQRIVKKNASL